MAGRFSTHRVAAPALVPAVEEAFAETRLVDGLVRSPRRAEPPRAAPPPIRC